MCIVSSIARINIFQSTPLLILEEGPILPFSKAWCGEVAANREILNPNLTSAMNSVSSEVLFHNMGIILLTEVLGQGLIQK